MLPGLEGLDPYWEISGNIATVREAGDGTWAVDMPDEEVEPLPDVTIAWLLWHVRWWWTNAFRWAEGERGLTPQDVGWSGTVEQAVADITQLHRRWVDLVEAADLGGATASPAPHSKTFAGLAAWVTVELTKNVAELGALAVSQRNLTTPTS